MRMLMPNTTLLPHGHSQDPAHPSKIVTGVPKPIAAVVTGVLKTIAAVVNGVPKPIAAVRHPIVHDSSYARVR